MNGYAHIDTFNSLGKPHKIKKLGLQNSVHRNVNKFVIQSNSPSNICGLYCLWFIFIRLCNRNTTFNFSKLVDKARNDKLVSLFYKKMILFQNKQDFIHRLSKVAFELFGYICTHR